MFFSSRTYRLWFLLAVLWVLLSGFFTPLLLTFGVLSCLLCSFISFRMDEEDNSHMFGTTRVWATIKYLFWLSGEVIKSNIDVTRRVISPKMPISPVLFEVPANQKTLLGKVIYANSITLTPGTVSMNISHDKILVHALTQEGADDLLAGEMGRRVAELER